MKKILLLIILFGVINSVYAVDVGIIVEFSDGTVKTDCVNVNENTDGFKILEKSVFDILWSPESIFGSLICKIEGEGTEISGNFCEFFGDFWNFNILPNGNNEWIHSPVGHNGPGGCWNRNVLSFGGHYCSVDKDVIGYKFGSGGDEPPLRTYEQVCEKLKVKDVKVYVDGKKESGPDEDGGKIDVIPGSKLELKIELENLYTNDEDIDINDITIEGTLEDIDDGNDIDDEANEFDLDADDDKKITLKFNIPLEVEEDEYDLIIEIEGENERGFFYSQKIDFEVEVEKEKHDIIFDQLKFLDYTVQCGSSANLEVKVVNLGTEEENVELIISNLELGINIIENFELSDDPFQRDNSFDKNYRILLPSDIPDGLYVLRGDLSYGNDIESETVEMIVACKENTLNLEQKSEDIKEEVQTQIVQTSQLIQTTTNVVRAAVSDTVEEKNLSNNDILMFSTITAGAIILIAGIILLVFLFRK